jgi:AcrR family transcriptional regulator
MRRLGQELGVEAPALYRHVRDKDDIVDSATDAVVGDRAG